MKLALSSTAVANTSHFPVGITGAIVSEDWGVDVVGWSCASIAEWRITVDPYFSDAA
jgi:hypothetical protein